MYAYLSFPLLLYRIVLALQDMLPTLMSQMGMATEGAFGGKADQQTGNGQSGATNEQAGDDEVPGMSK